MGQVTLQGSFELLNCANCSISFAIPTKLNSELMRNHETFYCPKGHSNYYPGKSDEEKLQEEIHSLEKSLSAANERTDHWYKRTQEEKRSKAAHKAHYTILKKKVKKGQCPCCDKIFPDVAEHIKTTHPDYNKKMKVRK